MSLTSGRPSGKLVPQVGTGSRSHRGSSGGGGLPPPAGTTSSSPDCAWAPFDWRGGDSGSCGQGMGFAASARARSRRSNTCWWTASDGKISARDCGATVALVIDLGLCLPCWGTWTPLRIGPRGSQRCAGSSRPPTGCSGCPWLDEDALSVHSDCAVRPASLLRAEECGFFHNFCNKVVYPSAPGLTPTIFVIRCHILLYLELNLPYAFLVC